MQQRSIVSRKAVASVTVLALFLSACGGMSTTQKGTAGGAGVGTVLGAAVGAMTGGGKSTRKGAMIGAAAGALGGYFWSKKMEEQKQAMEESTAGTGVKVVQTPDNQLKLDIPSDISFDSGKAAIRPDFRPILEKFAQTLVSNPAATVRIIGHTDSRGSDAVNNPLSVNRAASARDYLVSRGVAAQRFTIDGRGSMEPVADNTSSQGRARNRRVEIFVGEAAPAPQGAREAHQIALN